MLPDEAVGGGAAAGAGASGGGASGGGAESTGASGGGSGAGAVGIASGIAVAFKGLEGLTGLLMFVGFVALFVHKFADSVHGKTVG